MKFDFIFEVGTIEMSEGLTSYNYSFEMNHQNIPKVTLVSEDNQNVFVSSVSQTQMTVNKSAEVETTIRFQAVSKGKK